MTLAFLFIGIFNTIAFICFVKRYIERMWNACKKIVLLTTQEKVWLLVFLIGSLVISLALRFISVQRILGFLGHPLENRTLMMLATKQQRALSVDMARVMGQVANNVPWPCECLVQAICVKWLLNRNNIPSVLYFGVRIDDPKSLKAHAWIDVQQDTVIGGPQHQSYKVISTFISPELSK